MSAPPDDPSSPPWLDAQEPHDEMHSRAQLEGLRRLLDPAPKRVLDLGCGFGRALAPLAAAGHAMVGLDRDAEALRRCGERLAEGGGTADLVEGDFLIAAALPAGPFDAALCLGNTFMIIADVDDAVDLLIRLRGVLAAGGAVVIDDCPRDFWPELVEGNWLSGISADGTAQLVWDEGDALFALRHGSAIDPHDWRIKPDDRTYRLWSDGALRLAARAAGLSAPQRLAESHLLMMRCP